MLVVMVEMTTSLDEGKLTNPLLLEVLRDAVAIQDRFVPEPMLKTTGQGVLKSRGVEGLLADAEELRNKYQRKDGTRLTR